MSNIESCIRKWTENLRCVVLREAEYQWEDADNEKYEPDISILCGIRHRKKLCYTDVPRFICEILSDSTENVDRTKKMEVYAKVGVQEYWLADWRVRGGKIERYMLSDDGEKFLLHDIIDGKADPDAEINIISFPNWYFKMSDLMKNIGDDSELIE